MKILAINPGSTSTKMAVFEDEKEVFSKTLRHNVDELKQYPNVIDQFAFRKQLVIDALKEHDIPFSFDAVVGRGGLLRPIPGGVYEVNDAMVHDIRLVPRSHACNLGCLIARNIADELGCRAFIADPGIVDEMSDIARITGSPLMPRITTWHALNQRAIGRRYAAEQTAQHPDKPIKYENLNLIICHLGGGISIAAHKAGKAVDVNNALDGDGPFSPERAGTLPAGALVDLCFSGKYTKEEIKKMLSGKGGLAAHLGSTNLIEIEDNIANGDKHAALILDAMAYNIAKGVGALAPVFDGKVDAILITGGIARSTYVLDRLVKSIEFIAPVHIYPGEDELLALALNAIGALKGEIEMQTYTQA